MKTLKTLFLFGLIIFVTNTYGQELPENYQAMFNEMVTHFETIRSGNSVNKGKTTLTVFSETKIVLKTTHKKSVKNLTFIKEANKENKLEWVATNQLTIDMVNKYEEDLTKILMKMHELSLKKSKE
jgi:hypothetical protein